MRDRDWHTSVITTLWPKLMAAIGTVLLCCSVAEAQTSSRISFSRVVTEPGLGRLEFVLAVADLDDDGRDDILAGGRTDYYNGATAEERFTKTRLHVFVSVGDGSFRHAPELVEGTIDVRNGVVVADDFNGDTHPDLAVFDSGVFVDDGVGGHGNPPQLFLSSDDGRLRPSEALADAVRREHELRPQLGFYSGPADLHVKLAASGDIDGDGDIDLWVESTGGRNVTSHFMVNNGDGTFTLDPERAPYELLHNRRPEFWRHLGNDLVDLDNDGDLDLALGQLRDLDPTHINQFSIVLVNDGTGHYAERIELPHPAFYDGYTAVEALTHFDVNGDGFDDLLLVHERNHATLLNVTHTGRYIQVLINDGTAAGVLRRRRAMSFVDETLTRMSDQSATTPERNAEGNRLQNTADPRMHDVDRDGCADLVMSRNRGRVRTESPLVYHNNGRGRFQAMAPEPFAGSDREFGTYAVPADVNGDTVIDFVVPVHHNGPDNRYSTEDDFTTLVTLLNTTPPGPVRCE
ncbi:MAG: VCBS repeat-containing protein [Gammaproteobacteria bacterium]|nr:VCBS repeat-containing protein [Gammaproteobacteria bacterium]